MKHLFLLFILGISMHANSQALQWANSMGTTSITTVANKVMSDASGSVFNVGYFTGTVDFQSGAGVNALTSGSTSINGYIQKLGANGTFAWVKGFLGTGACNIKNIVADASGSLYITGGFAGTIDFDPGATTYTMTTTAATESDLFVCKLTAGGVFVWAKQIGGIYNDYGLSIDLDGSNNVFINGYCNAMTVSPQYLLIDMDPGAGVSNLGINGQDGIVVKLDNNGNYITSQNYGGSGPDYTYSLKLDATGNVYICGYAWSGVGQLAIGASGVYDTGFIAKLTNSLVKTWAIPLRGAPGAGYCGVRDIEIDAVGNVYAVGEFKGVVDFDAGVAPTYTMATTSLSEADVFVTKVTSAGGFVWAKQIASGTSNAYGLSLALDASNNLFFTGYFTGAADFDPTAASYTKYSAGTNDVYVCKLDANGNFTNEAQVYGSTGSDVCYSISSPAAGTYYICGSFNSTVDFNEGTGTTNLIGAGVADAFVAKYAACAVPPITTASSSTLVSVCQNGTKVLSATAATGITFNWFNVAGGGTSLGVGNTFTTSPITTTTSIWAEGANACAASPVIQYSINMIPSPTVSLGASSANVCEGTVVTLTGGGAGITSFTWNTGATTQSIAVTPSVTTQYTVSGSNGTCIGTRTVNISVVALPSVTLTASSPSICPGVSTILTAIGAQTYSWSTGTSNSTGTISVAPTTSTTYSVNAQKLGCYKMYSINITVNPSPTVAVSNQTACAGNSVNLTASGATTYSWNTGATTSSISVAPTSNTTYTVIGASGGCTNTKTVSVSVSASPTVAANSVSVCAGNAVNVTASGAASYSWNTGATTASISVTPTSTTVYTVTGTTTGCTNTKTVTVTVNALPNTSVSSTTICSGSTGTLAASGASTYSWNTGSTNANLAVNPTVNTNYTVTGTSAAGCVKTATASVTVGSAPSIAANSTSICIGSSATIMASGVNTYTWNTSSNSSSITVSPTSTTVYTVSGNLVGCATTAVKVVTVTVNALPVVTLANITSPLCVANASVALAGTPSGGTYSGAGVSGASFNPSVSGAGTFTVTYNYTDVNSCSAVASKTVMVSSCTSLTEAIEVNTDINIYPNPNNGDFTILIPTKGTYTIVNAIGQIVETIELKEDAQQINVSGLSQGMYYVIGKTSKVKVVVTK
ncbi:MAG: T9SS type A sorting domain-containing protein [Bacteroidetes bacterium]|nr:T9SS type A sorting domain-containing protein [Bacteroidota bacterium]